MKSRMDKTPVLLFLGCMFFCWLYVWRQGIFGSEIDWISQHSVYPDYFRQLYYGSGSLFTNFAPQIGGGQNLFQLSYYGLYNPIILISYFLPFIKMSDYIMWSSMVCYGLSVVIFYFWIREKCANRIMSGGTAVMFSLAAPLLYHSYNHLMFVNYMPFLCLALIGTDRYLKKQKSGLLIMGTVGMILCSYYFSIGGMLALFLYAISEYCKQQKVIHLKDILIWLFRYGIRIGTAVLMCGVLLVPTALALNTERAHGFQFKLFWFLPGLEPEKLLFHPHGIGLSILALFVLIRGLFYPTWRERLLSILLMTVLVIPAFGYALNGGLYSKSKVFIPFLPLCCYLFVPYLNYLNEAKEEKRRKFGIAIPYIAAVTLFFVDYGFHTISDVVVSKSFYDQITSNASVPWIQQQTKADSTLFRTEELGDREENKANINRIRTLDQLITSMYSSAYNAQYTDFRNNTLELNEPYRNNMMQSVTDNPCFLQFMGVKHLISNEYVPGYTLLQEENGKKFWENTNAFPIIYATNQLMEESSYISLPFPDNQTALLQKAVIQGVENTTTAGSVFHEITGILPENKDPNRCIQKTSDGYEIIANEEMNCELSLKKGETDDLLAVSFMVENLNPNQDMYVKVENQTNLLTAEQHEYANHNEKFSYVLGIKADQQQVKLTFGKGRYRLHNWKTYVGSWESIGNTHLCQNVFLPAYNQWKTGWNGVSRMEGTIHADAGSYLITSIPYDEGFSILVDGKESKSEIVNTAFLGCKLEEGVHQIQIQYHARGFQVGLLLTLLGILLFVSLIRKL